VQLLPGCWRFKLAAACLSMCHLMPHHYALGSVLAMMCFAEARQETLRCYHAGFLIVPITVIDETRALRS
jgi:hypothetical protein